MQPAEMLRKVADAIDSADEDAYDQSVWIVHDGPVLAEVGNIDHVFGDLFEHKCGTAACLAGWATAIEYQNGGLREEVNDLPPWRDLSNVITGNASHLMGLDQDAADCLFESFWGPRSDLTVPQALRILAEKAETGRLLTLGDVLEVSSQQIVEDHTAED